MKPKYHSGTGQPHFSQKSKRQWLLRRVLTKSLGLELSRYRRRVDLRHRQQISARPNKSIASVRHSGSLESESSGAKPEPDIRTLRTQVPNVGVLGVSLG